MLGCLAGAIPGGERVISVEEVRELRMPHPDWVAMETRQAGLEGTGEITLRDLVRESLRMRPTRIVVGEVRSSEALDLLLALNSGLPRLTNEHIQGDARRPRRVRYRVSCVSSNISRSKAVSLAGA